MGEGSGPRVSRSLDGEWLFEVDPEGIGLADNWNTRLSTWITEALTVDVPHVWQENDELREYTGRAWYHRTFRATPEELSGRQAFLEFEAVDYWTTVWVNDTKIGEHRGGYLPFEFEITDAITEGENTLVVSVHDPADLHEIPHGKQGDPWYTRVSGIWQSVSLQFRPDTRVTRAAITPDLASDAAIVDLKVETGEYDPSEVHASARAYRDGTLAAIDTQPVSSRRELLLTFDSPDYWSPNSPALYDLEITLEVRGTVVDRYEDYFGLRSIEQGEDGYLLNGEPIRFRGVLDHGYYPHTLYRPPDKETINRELEVIKELGFNLVRKHLKPAHPTFLELADRKGILVWEEPASPGRYTQRSKDRLKNDVHDLIERDYNHPSVVIWSVYNEELGIGHYGDEETLWTDETKQAYLESIVESVREWDETRLVCDNSGWGHVNTDLNDYHRYYMSHHMTSNFEDDLNHILHHRADNYATLRWSNPGDPVFITKFGTWPFPDINTLTEGYGGEPPWFSNESLANGMKRPSGVRRRFVETDLVDVFGTMGALSDAWQQRSLVSLEHSIGEIRKREDVAGFVLAQLRDVEWQFGGLFDYMGNEKSFLKSLKPTTDDISLVVSPDTHVAWSGDVRTVDVSIVNDTGDSIAADIEVEFDQIVRERTVSVPPCSVRELEPVELPVSPVETVRTEPVIVRGIDDLSDTEPITIAPWPSKSNRDVTIYADGPIVSDFAALGFSVTHQFDSNTDVAIVHEITKELSTFASNGGSVIQIPTDRNRMRESEFFDFRDISRNEGWENAASLFYQSSPILSDICLNSYLEWEFEDAYPHQLVSDIDPKSDTIHVGYVYGWLEGWSSPLLERSVGDGSIIVCTFQPRPDGELHPIVTLVLLRLLEKVTG